jgi:hypothetical protein
MLTMPRAAVGLHQVVDVEHRFAEELLRTLAGEFQQAALDRAYAGSGDVAVFGGEVLGVVAHMLHHGAQVLEIEQQHAVVVGDLEHQREHALLRVVEVEHAPEQQRPHVGHGGTYRMALFAFHIPERHRVGTVFEAFQFQLFDTRLHLGVAAAGFRDAGQVALDVGHEHRHADAAERLRQRLQGDGLAGTGGAGDEAVAVGHLRQQDKFVFVVLGDQERGCHGNSLLAVRAKIAGASR